ncbi:DUF58 domain-containing protein [Arcobacter caeni]|uniref:DUF58 domain-containing protein n=1 Tax=Arcobacter caeni TaxID=1912877 RepID=A0A363CYU0_9BACT|nr:DUF58 domain-containing protein [Arcobacter caeni]PUE63977.1 hypothetical protein B0174_08020 [Arcobacter caeni]
MYDKAKEIIIKAKTNIFNSNLGGQLTSLKGEGLDFKEIKEYSYGDNIKNINWKATAKSNSLKVNVFDESRQLNIIVAFLINGSLEFGSVNMKQDIAAEIIALLGFSSIYNHDLLFPIFFSNKSEIFYEPTYDETIIYKLIQDALEIKCIKKEVNYKNFCDYVNNTMKQRSVIFVVGDFYGDVDLSQIAYKNDVYALIVRDRLEEYPLLNGEFELVNAINLKSSEFNITKDVAKKYKELLDLQDEQLEEHFLKHRIKHGKIYTDDDIFLRLSQIIKG